MVKGHRVHAMALREELTAEMIREVYGVDVMLKDIDGKQVVVPI